MAMQATDWRETWAWLKAHGWRPVLDGTGERVGAWCSKPGCEDLIAEGDDEAAALAALARRAAGMEGAL